MFNFVLKKYLSHIKSFIMRLNFKSTYILPFLMLACLMMNSTCSTKLMVDNTKYRASEIDMAKMMYRQFRSDIIKGNNNYGGYLDMTLSDLRNLSEQIKKFYGESVNDKTFIRIYPGLGKFSGNDSKPVFMVTYFAEHETSGSGNGSYRVPTSSILNDIYVEMGGGNGVLTIPQSDANSPDQKLPCPKHCDSDKSLLGKE